MEDSEAGHGKPGHPQGNGKSRNNAKVDDGMVEIELNNHHNQRHNNRHPHPNFR